jgi:APA family basic amino acid/polyamine antiporter
MSLKRELGLWATVLYGLGVILGAGIYALIAIGAGLAGDMLWLPFLISAAIAIFTALSYAELSSMFPKEAAEYNYTRKAFGRESFSFSIGWVLAIGTVIAATTVAIGFGGYFSSLTGVEPRLAAIGLIVVMTFLNYLGIKESAWFNAVSTLVEVLGLVLVVIVAFLLPAHPGVDFLSMPQAGYAGMMAAVSVIFFAFIGFENLANLSEEVKDSRNTVPKALIISLVISTILYMLVAVAAIYAVGWEALSQSKAPLTLVVSAGLGQYASILSYIALFATANTALMFLIVPSRILYGMSAGGSLQGFFSTTGSRGTPYFSVALVGLAAALLASALDMKTVAQLADLAVFIAYLSVNAAVIALAASGYKRRFESPRALGVPVLAWLGALSALFLLMHFPPELWLVEALIAGAGFVLFLSNKIRRSRSRSSRS